MPEERCLRLIDVFRARKRIAPYVRRTPLVPSVWLSELTGASVSLKLESLQVGRSFKTRGAFNAVMARLERGDIGRGTTLVTASAGNHGRSLAAAAEAIGLPLVVFTPGDAPQTKMAAIRRHGATLRAEGRDYDHAELLAKRFAAETGAAFISPYSDVDVIGGAATIAVELFEDAPDTDVVVVPIGGGGLVSGIASTVKRIAAARQVVGVELDVSHAFQTSVRAGRLVPIAAGPSLAEGLGGNPEPETITFGFIQRHVDRIVTVSEEDLRAAVVGLADAEHLIVEASGAAGVAALMGKRLEVRGSRVAVIVTGSNIDRARLASLLGSG
jgi:threonine dehydratase